MSPPWPWLVGSLGAAVALACIFRLRRVSRNLADLEERHRLVSSVALDYVFSSMLETDGRLVLRWVSGAFGEITGYSFAEYVERGGWRAAVHPDDLARDDADLQTLRSNRPLKTELRTIAKDGRVVWVEVFAHPVWDPSLDRLAGIYGSVRDVSRRKRAELETLATLELLNQLVDSVPAFCSYVDSEERYQFVNRYHENWFKNSRERFIGRRLAEVHRPSTYAVMRPYSRRALDGEAVRYDHEMTGRDGKHYCFDVRYVPRRSGDGTVLGYFSLVFDDTDRVLRDRQLLRTQRLESVGRLASGIAHDLNNILSPIMMGPDLLRESVRDPAGAAILDMFESSARRGSEILRQLLTFGRGESDALSPLRIAPLVKDMAKIVAETFPKNVSASFQIPPDLPPVLGNVTQLHQVLMNLCINARDAMPSGGSLDVSASLEQIGESGAAACGAPAPGPYVVLRVADSGTGIPPEVVDKIFDPFFTTKPVGVGTGLGLSTVLGIVRGHHGFIRVDSLPGRGTAFFVHLPSAGNAACTDLPPAPSSSDKGNGEWILLVDDEESARQVARQILERNGYRVVEARDGREGLAAFECDPSRFALVLADLMMPGMDGAEMLRRIQSISPRANAIAVSGGLSKEEMAQALECDSVAFLVKPFSAIALLDSVRRAIRPAHALK